MYSNIEENIKFTTLCKLKPNIYLRLDNTAETLQLELNANNLFKAYIYFSVLDIVYRSAGKFSLGVYRKQISLNQLKNIENPNIDY